MPNTLFSDEAVWAILPSMFLRLKFKPLRGSNFRYWHLSRTVRTARGPRHQVVASLGKLEERELAGLRSPLSCGRRPARWTEKAPLTR